MGNKYANGTLAQRGDVVYSDGGRYVMVNPTYSNGFVGLTTIENPTGFTRKAPIATCTKHVPDDGERQRAFEVLNKIPSDTAKPNKGRKVSLILIGAFVLMCTLNAKAQDSKEPVFTVVQCRADQSQWFAKLAVPSQAGTKSVLAGALLSWSFEMGKCVSVDQANSPSYLDVERMAIAVVADRMNDFINRHGLTNQFFDEDVAGKR